MAMCGDGATSEGDFHEALNFAAVFHLPVVFFVQNNEYAISVPLAHQSVAPSLAHKAVGLRHARRARGRQRRRRPARRARPRPSSSAREGSGPLLVEAHTYRMQAHTNADDATRYRQDSEVAAVGGQGPAQPDGDLPDATAGCSTTTAPPGSPRRPKRLPRSCATASARTSRWTRRTSSTTCSPRRPRS